jgi:hypothetical protein
MKNADIENYVRGYIATRMSVSIDFYFDRNREKYSGVRTRSTLNIYARVGDDVFIDYIHGRFGGALIKTLYNNSLRFGCLDEINSVAEFMKPSFEFNKFNKLRFDYLYIVQRLCRGHSSFGCIVGCLILRREFINIGFMRNVQRKSSDTQILRRVIKYVGKYEVAEEFKNLEKDKKMYVMNHCPDIYILLTVSNEVL